MSKNFKNKDMNKSKKRKVILISIFIIISLILGIGIGILSYTYNLLGKVDRVTINKDDIGINKNIIDCKEIKNIALLGIDSTNGNAGRSDSIMILTIDNNKNQLRVSSIMRDSYVNIDGHGQDKLNHAYAFGGAQLSLKTINKTYDLNVSDFVSVNFSNLPKIIDQLGGIKLNITKDELKYINQYINYLNKDNKTNVAHITESGIQHVNGTQALAYSRIRYTAGGDYERTHRHRIVLTALFNKFKSTSPTEYPKLLNELLPMVKTNLTPNQILGLASDVVKMGNVNLEQDRFPLDSQSEGKIINGIWYLIFDKEKTTTKLHEFIFNGIK
ncbi:LCP family protein [Clostridium tarantellae]|uniref:LytR family transcriptional regulator n=1 Tax=Clostridium tarantellae TaxID=39493 RepID=A0A6I1MSL7_9CLOT|nr:LCP family protein [Clostridium tarantellae]MPQ45177.1 LytR family transcriptional regulator [Clostridium tarantellae]